MTDKLITLTKWLIFSLFDFFVLKKVNVTKKTLLLIRLDAIGDYVLFRNFIEILKNNHQYRGCKITLCGNIAWKELAENLDNNYIDEFIWLDPKKFTRNLWYRYKKLKEITATGYEVVISPVYSREFFFSDNIVKLVSATEKVGSTGDLQNSTEWKKSIADRYYTKLLPANHGLLFEFYRNREFFTYLLNEQINLIKPNINLPKIDLAFSLPKNYAVLFIGASKLLRKWPISYYVEIASFLKETQGLEVVLCGGSGDKIDAKLFGTLIKNDFIDLVGKTTLLEFLSVIRNASIMITNETSAPHFAIAVDGPEVLVISNGNSYLRFNPYPVEMTKKYHIIYHPDIENDLDAYAAYCANNQLESTLSMNDISVKSVLNKIDEIITKRQN